MSFKFSKLKLPVAVELILVHAATKCDFAGRRPIHDIIDPARHRPEIRQKVGTVLCEAGEDKAAIEVDPRHWPHAKLSAFEVVAFGVAMS